MATTPRAHRKHPVSIAVSMALLAAAASAAAADATAAPVENAPAQSAAAQNPAQADALPEAQSASAARAEKARSGTGAANPATREADALATVTVIGVRQSQIRAIELKRLAPSIQDSISAESIGQLPDTTITDALQRITGVQINRDGGIGTSVDVRGLPQVSTMLNGEVFITPDQIDSQQPDFTTLPATLFNQVDVIKSPTSAQAATGISGAIDLHSYRPWDLPHGFTYSYALNGERGDITRKTGKEGNGLISYNGDGRWGLQLSADYSDTTRNGPGPNGTGQNGNPSEGLDQYGTIFHGENAASAGAYNGFVGAWNGAPIPPQIRQFPDGSVDVNGDGKNNGVFMGSQDISLYDITTQRKRKSGNASFQFDFGDGFTFTSDYFYAHQDQWDRNIGIQFNSTNWQGATYVPLQSRNTGATTLGQYNTPPPDPNWAGSQIYTTQVYEKWPGDVESYSQIVRWDSTAQNLNGQLDFNNGGPFKGSVRGIYEKAHQSNIETDINISDSDGCLWADSRTGLPCGTFVYPAQLGGNRVFNANGIPQNTVPITADFRGRNLVITLPAALASAFANPNAWTMKTLEASDSYDRRTSLGALRFDGQYDFTHGVRLRFGVRNAIRNGGNDGFTFVTPVYGGMGATNPNGTPNASGCLVRYVGSDVILQGNGDQTNGPPPTAANTWCTAYNSQGYFRAGPLSSQPISKTPPALANNFREYINLLGSGITFWGINPYAMDNPLAFWRSLYPNTTTQEAPGTTWNVWQKELSSYLQADLSGELGGMSYSGNVGVRFIHTNLDITQHLTGAPGEYGTESADNGTQETKRSYSDVLPAVNFALNMTDQLVLRLSYAKNMMPLNLSQWAGGLTLGYSLQETATGPIYRVSQGTSSGNPGLNPWRSTNYGASFEYYINPTSMIGLEGFYIDVHSFINNGAVVNCNLPDEDGVYRHHCVTITQPVQGSGNSIHGVEFDYRQGFTFLPGLLANTGMEFNFTYAPSDTHEVDLAGNKVPFQDNSTESGNLILWYQSKRFQVRLAYNYRSKRAFMDSVGGIAGMEEYEAPQKYLDAAISYKVSKYAELFVNGSNLTNEYQRFYLVWPDQPAHSTFSERSYQFGVRGQW
ncbi:MAG: TonB-dependent receptor [Proteobacteria bacterium]|nr:TonB-dependent receptor [Pseudomonadota bacterium]